MRTNSILAGSAAAALAAAAAAADPTSYPLEIENCGQTVTFERAPERAVALGQNSAEILLLLGLQDRMAATAFWPNTVLPELEEANSQVEVLTVEFPTLESVLSKQPDFVAAMLVTLLGPDSRVAKREDFHALGIPTYLSPSACSTEQNADDAYGNRDELWTMDLLYQEINELARIFDVADRGQALIADFKAREAALREQFDESEDLTFLFWFSSPSPADDAYLGGGNGPSGYIADALSGGERQRVHIARALAQSPQVMFLDEPTNHLDIHHQIEILQLIRDLDLTSVVALHDLNLAAMFCDRIVVLLAGAVVASGSPASVLTEALLREVFRIRAGVSPSPYHGRPHIHLMAV